MPVFAAFGTLQEHDYLIISAINKKSSEFFTIRKRVRKEADKYLPVVRPASLLHRSARVIPTD